MLAEFINGLNPSDEVFLIAFSAKPRMLQPLTTDHHVAVQSLSQLHAFGQTSIYDSIVLAVGEFGKGPHTSRALMLITDGIDNTSSMKEEDAIAALKATDVRIYAIGIGDPNAPHRPQLVVDILGENPDSVDAKALQDMTLAAGGAVFIVPPMDKDAGKGFTAAVRTISSRLGHSYTIGVVLPPGIATSDLQFTVANQPDAVVTTHIMNPLLP
jgi:hypothetical protein